MAASKREENQRETTGEVNNQSFPIRKRKDSMEEQNSLNEENNRNTQRQETEAVTG